MGTKATVFILINIKTMTEEEEYLDRKLKEFECIMKGEKSHEGCLIVLCFVVLLGVLLAVLSPFIFAMSNF